MTGAYHAHCDWPRVDSAATSPCKHPRWVLATSILASSLAFLDGSIVNVALPALGKGLHGAANDLQWTINGYLLPLSALLLFGGALGDNFGRRRLLIGGVVVFALASLGCALARTFEFLVAMRALQGVGAAMLMPNSLALLGAAFPGEARGQAIGTWAAAGVGASAIGPPLGGWLIGVAGWQAIFLLNIPLALITVALAWRYVPEVSDGDLALDWLGAVLATAALGLLTWAITLWSTGKMMHSTPWLLLAGGVAALAAFVAAEHRRGDHAMMPLAMFGSRDFVGLTLVTFLLYAALGGLFILLPYILIEGGYTPLQAGLGLLPFSVVVGAVSRPMGRLAARIGPRWPLTVGSCVAALGYVLLVRLDPAGSYWTNVVPGAGTVSLGMAGAVAPLTAAVLAAVDSHHTGTASGFNSAVGRIGGLIATALSGAVLMQTGAMLLMTFHASAWVGAGLALASAVAAFILLASGRARPAADSQSRPANRLA